jgi:glycosyltransferase involved in cell wall biosynthesis
MKIGIIGNMNNSYFSLARYLRDEGYDCELLILANEPVHFDPSCDTFSEDYSSYCKNVSWGDAGDFLKQDFSLVEKDLAPYQFLIGNGPAPAYVAKVGRILDVFIPYGYDIYSLPFFRLVHPIRQLAYASVARYQRKGIRESSYILFDRTNKAFEKLIKKLNYPGQRIVSPAPMIYHKDYENGWHEKTATGPLAVQLKKLRAESEILLVQHGRQIWKNSADQWSYKGNNLLVEGYAQFVKEHPLMKIKLVLFEYGDDVEETKKLVGQLGVENAVVWMPKMARNKLMTVLAASDMIIGELHHSWLTYGVALEALCMGKPFMHKRIDSEFSDDYPELYPMLHAFSAQSVYEGLTTEIKNKSGLKDIGKKGREWFMTYCVNRPVAVIKKMIDEKSSAIHA